MTLYRVDYSKHRWSTLNPFEATGSPIHKLEAEGVLVPVTEELLSRAEWEATIKDNPVIDMGDDNLWVMVDLGNPDAVGEETP